MKFSERWIKVQNTDLFVAICKALFKANVCCMRCMRFCWENKLTVTYLKIRSYKVRDIGVEEGAAAVNATGMSVSV